MSEQLVFAKILAEADDQRRAALDRHRQRIQTWFDGLPECDRAQLAEWLAIFEWDTHVTLAAAAGDYRASHVMNRK
jgi:hypothetical protein